MKTITTLILSCLLLGACATSGGDRPTWVKSPNLDHPEFYYIIGVCHEKLSMDRARRCAVADAKQQLSSTFGARGGIVRDEHHEDKMGTYNRGGKMILGVVHSAWVLLAFPRNRVKRR